MKKKVTKTFEIDKDIYGNKLGKIKNHFTYATIY